MYSLLGLQTVIIEGIFGEEYFYKKQNPEKLYSHDQDTLL